MAEDVLGLELVVREGDRGDQVDQAAEIVGVELEAGVRVLGEHVLERLVLLLDRSEGVVDEQGRALDGVILGLAVSDLDLGLRRELGPALQILPAGKRGHPKRVLARVVVAVFQLGVEVFVRGVLEVEVALGVLQLDLDGGATGVERVRDVLEEDEPEDGVLVLGGVEVVAQLVGRGPELPVQLIQERLRFTG